MLALSAGLLLLRLECIELGPDPDTDAYGHHVIGRQLLETPLNLRIHWVWLPLYHALLALGIWAGAVHDHVRQVNAVLSALTPLLLLGVPLSETKTDDMSSRGQRIFERGVLALAATLAASVPIAVKIGTTGQPEPLFTALLSSAALALAARRCRVAALLLSLAVLTRYEAWVAVASLGGVLAWRLFRRRQLPEAGLVWCVVAPLLTALSWTLARWAGGEPWLGFLKDNQAFAEAARSGTTLHGHLWPAGFALEPQHLGWLALAACALLGLPRTARRHGIWFVVLPAGVITFLIVGWLTRSHLGLERHWVATSPFVALWIANGVAWCVELPSWGNRWRSLALAGFGLLSAALFFGELGASWLTWRQATRDALLDRRAVAGFLQHIPPDALVVCDEASVEVLSELPRRRFVRTFVSAAAGPRLAALATERDVYVVSWRKRLQQLSTLGYVAYEAAPAGHGDALMALHLSLRARD